MRYKLKNESLKYINNNQNSDPDNSTISATNKGSPFQDKGIRVLTS
jgi:hypothetical protein